MKPKNKAQIYFLAFAISAGSFVMGYSLSQIQQANNIPSQQIHYYLSIIITLLPLGAIVGSLVSKKLVNLLLGQKNILIWVDAFMIVAIVMQMYSISLWSMYISRFMFGVFCGISSSIIPIYLTSLAPLEMVGAIGSLNQLMITVGISVAYAMQFFLQADFHQTFSADAQIDIFIGVNLLFCVLRMGVLISIFPYDTAQTHFKRHEMVKVKEIAELIYENGTVDQLVRYKNLSSYKPGMGAVSHSINERNKSLINPSTKNKIIALALVVAIANQMSGVNAIFFYAKQLFNNLTNNDENAVKQNLLYLGMFQVVVTYFSAMVLDRYGRRPLMLLGETIIVFSLIGAYVCTNLLGLSPGFIGMFVFSHILGFSLSLGPISMIYASQILEDISPVIILIWVETLIVSLISDMMINSLGIGLTFLSYGIVSIACLIYLTKEMIQTKGLNRKQIEAKFSQKAGINGYQQKHSFQSNNLQMEQIIEENMSDQGLDSKEKQID